MSKGRRIARIPNFVPTPEERARYLLHWESRHLFHGTADYPALTPQFLFNTDQPFTLEIGPGTGELLCALAAENPSQNYFGVDLSRRSLYYALHQAAQAGLTNIRFLRADILLALPRLAPASLAGVLLLFPDPNLAARHRRRRAFQPALLDALAVALAPAARILVVSDDEDLFTDMLAIAEADPRYRKTHAAPWLDGFEPPVKTRFQQVWEKKGRVIKRFELERVTAG
ncbi:MAG: methyltransferase domain-containing protein [Anaerolineae bacterium]|nr:MAG: methyltransferase domain-containing protein [Anaerolineae bacterium]